MKFKEGVRLFGNGVYVQSALIVALQIFEFVYQHFFPGKQIMITSIMDGYHDPAGLHPKGLAADCRANDIPDSVAYQIRDEAKKFLDKDCDIIVHGEGDNFHFHIEVQPVETK